MKHFLALDDPKMLDSAKNALQQTRNAYKRIEFLTEYFSPETAIALNGPVLDKEVDDEGNEIILKPQGLQVIEVLLFSDTINQEQLTGEVKRAMLVTNRLEQITSFVIVTDDHILNSFSAEILRIYTKGITGFDAPIMRKSIPEASVSLKALTQNVALYYPYLKDRNFKNQLRNTLSSTIKYADQNPDFNSFDRLTFIREYAEPL